MASPIPVIEITRARTQERDVSPDSEKLFREADMIIDEAPKDVEKEKEQASKANDSVDKLCDQVENMGKSTAPVFRFKYLIVTDQEPKENSFEFMGLLIEWIYVKKSTPMNTMNEVCKILDDEAPKYVIVWCFSKYIQDGNVNNDVLEALKLLRNRVWKCTVHKVVISDSPFPPALERSWKEISTYNFYVRNLNISMSMNPLTVAKAFLKKINHIPKMCVKANYWRENCEGSGLGSTISDCGWDKVRRWFGAHLLSGMSEAFNDMTALGREEIPNPLQGSPGFKEKPMVTFLKALGTYDPGWTAFKSKPKGPAALKNNLTLRPRLASIGRRQSTSSSGSSGSRRSQYSRQSDRPAVQDGRKFSQEEVDDKTKLVRLEREVCDLSNIVDGLKEAKEKEISKKRSIEDKLYNRLERLSAELEWQSKDRRSLESKISKLREDLRVMTEDRNHYRQEADDRYELAKAIGDRRKRD